MKIKTLTIIGITIAVFIFIGSIYVNFDLVVNVRYYTERNQNHVEELIEDQLRLDVSLNQWFDVKNKLSIRLLEPIQNQASQRMQSMQTQIIHFKTSLDEMNRVSIKRHQVAITELKGMLTQLSEDLDTFHAYITSEDVISASASYISITRQATAIQDRYIQMNSVVVNDLSLLINIAFVMMLIVLAILVFGMVRFVYFQIPYMVTSLTNLADKHYHQSLTKPKPFFIEEQNIHGYIDDLFEENRFIEDIRDVLINQYLVEDAMDQLFPLLQKRMGIDRIGLAFIDYAREVIVAEYGVIANGPLVLGPGFELPINYTSLNELIESKDPRISNDLEASFENRPNSASLKLLMN